MKEASYYKKLKENKVKCILCPNNCVILENNLGICLSRKNIKGKLYIIYYGKIIARNIDPIEKKPLYHFLPNSSTYSIASPGCNLKCCFCQNYEISQEINKEMITEKITPNQVVKNAIKNNCKSISYTYTEPSIFFEFCLDTAIIARKNNIKNVMVTNGFINIKPLKQLYKYIDAVNIDIKGFKSEIYTKYCKGKLNPILKNIKEIKKLKVHIEITYLIIPKINDDLKDILKMCKWIKRNLGNNAIIHFSRFFPKYKMIDNEITAEKILKDAYNIAKKIGLNYVYIGNTYIKNDIKCSKCNNILINRNNNIKSNIKNNKCLICNNFIPGFYE